MDFSDFPAGHDLDRYLAAIQDVSGLPGEIGDGGKEMADDPAAASRNKPSAG